MRTIDWVATCGLAFLTMTASVSAGSVASIYDVPLTWKNDQNQNFSFKSLKGKKAVVTMIYTSCPSACPLMMKKIKRVEAALKKTKTEAEFVLISFDSDFDKIAGVERHEP